MSYWEDRQIEMYKAGEMQVNQYFMKLEKAFNQAKRELQKTVESFYFRYAEENGLTYAAAQQRLEKAEVGELKDFIDLAMQNIGKYNQDVNNMSIKARITRYQALEAQVDAILRQLYAIDYQNEAEMALRDVYGETYYRTWYSVDRYKGFHSSFAQVDPRAVDKLMEYPFNGANFSSRLWKQKDHLQSQLMESFTTILIQGRNPQSLAGDFAKKMQSKKFEAYRLLQTESSFLMSEAAHAAYKEDGVEKYQILATLDSKTCGVCGELDGKIYAVDESVTGVNMPPFHCFCRCTDTPYYDDMDLSDMTRAARDPETGKTYKVPADMTWKEWKEKHGPASIKESAAEKNKKTDYLMRNHPGISDTKAEREVFEKAFASVPEKVQLQMEDIVVDVGQIGASQYDYVHDILYVAKGADTEDVIHEIGHMAENKILDREKVSKLIDDIVGEVSIFDISSEVYEDAAGNPREIFIVRNDKFVSEYQGRIYVENPIDAFNNDGHIKKELLMEFISEPFRVYITDPERLKSDYKEFYDLIKEAVE